MKQLSALMVVSSLVLTACGGGGGDDNKAPAPAPAPTNQAPTADAGADQRADENTQVTLTGSGSDSDGSIASYRWQQLSGPSVTLDDPNSASTTFTAPNINQDESLSFELTVTDDDGATASDSTQINLSWVNLPPVVNAGSEQSVDENTQVTLNGSASDEDGSIASLAWTQTTGTAVTLSDASVANPSFTAPDINADETLGFTLTATDNTGAQSTASVQVQVTWVNLSPVANAGHDITIYEGHLVTLSGSATDEDGSIDSYAWQAVTTEPAVSLTNADTATPSFTAPFVEQETEMVFELMVTDNSQASSIDQVTVTVFNGGLNDTGITTQHADGDDSQYGRDALAAAGQLSKVGGGHAGFDFSKLDGSGNPLPASASEWQCVRDNHTGLVWEVKTNDGGLHDKDHTYTWYNPDNSTNGGDAGYENNGQNTYQFAQNVNAAGLCGFTDWRLPTREELHSIVDYSRFGPAIDIDYFPMTINHLYWSSSPHADNSTNAWHVYFRHGDDGVNNKSDNYYVRLVRAGQ